ncbi:MAG: flavodoxin reductase [Fimbriimonadaceae bacterium]|nr:flavodoxin reductase [Chitinophagales bacterium]
MEEHVVKILEISSVTHNVNRYVVEKPGNYSFESGQATEVVINKEGWKDERRPFTFTGLNEWDNLEFTIKSYIDHKGVTNKLLELKQGDEFILHDVWGAIQYKGEGIFIAGGAGVTPFIAIFRALQKKGQIKNNKLIFANKTENDIILKDEFSEMLKDNFINILSDEKTSAYHHGFITKEFLQKYIDNKQSKFYVCGPPPMMDAVQKILNELSVGKDAVVVEL